MGWDWTKAMYFYKNGDVNRKAEVDSYLGTDRVLKSTMVGTVYYGACKVNENKVVGVVALTKASRWEIGFKLMDESMNPFCYDCPDSILDLLTPTDYEESLKWREECRKRNKKPKLSQLGVGSVIRFTCPCRTTYYNEGQTVTLVKQIQTIRAGRRNTYKWVSDGLYSWKPSIIPSDYTIIKAY